MQPQKKTADPFSFISSKGKSAEVIKGYSWKETGLGAPEIWSFALKSALNIILASDAPMYIAWGKDLTGFCNDAFAAICSQKLIGEPAAESFKENWELHAIAFREAFTGKSLLADQLISGKSEFEYAFSPLFNEQNEPAGVLVIPKKKPNAVPGIINLESHFYNLIMQAPMGITILKGNDFIIDVANEAYLELIDRKPETSIGKPLFDVLPELAGQGLLELLNSVLENGENFYGNEYEVSIFRNGEKQTAYFNFVYAPFFEDSEITGITVVAHEVTDLINSRKNIEETARQLQNMIMQSPVPVTIFRGEDHVIEMANKVMFEEIWRKTPEEVLGKKLLDVFPELKAQKYPELLKKVMDSGKPYQENESLAIVEGSDGTKAFYLDYEYAPLLDDDSRSSGILVTVNDVTEKVESKLRIQESETRLKIAIESAMIGTFDWDIVHADFEYSDRLAYMFGFSDPKKLNHKSFVERIHPEDVEIRLKAHDESFETGRLYYEARFVKPDESICWLRLNGQIFFDEKGVPQRMYGMALDITAEKTITNALKNEVTESKMELQIKNEQLSLSEERYHRMTEEVKDYAILLLDVDGTVLNWNQGAAQIKGYSESEIIGKNFSLFYLQEDKENGVPQKLIKQASEFGRAAQEGWRVRKDNSIFWASIVITALHNSKDEIVGFSKVTRDLTERKIAEDKLKQYNMELEFQNKELEQFAYIASHDLQEPLRKIQTFSGMLQNNLDDADAVNLYVGKIATSAKRMTELIKSVLNYSKLSKSVIEFEDVDLNELLENIKVDFELLIAEKDAVIIQDQLPVVRGIPLQLTQLFSNLLGNALKFADKRPEIRISSTLISDHSVLKFPNLKLGVEYFKITFSDNGIGFDKQYAKQIFDMFQRLHDKQSYSGTGIGLALCKRIVENHHGFISASSEIGEGATFVIYLPV